MRPVFNEIIEGGAYNKAGHIWQEWYRFTNFDKTILRTFKYVQLKSGKDSKKIHEICISYTKVDTCQACKRLTRCSYEQGIIFDDGNMLFRCCKKCNTKFLAINNQFYILQNCFDLLKEMRKEIKNANSNRRTIKRIPMYATVRH